ncbi:MAG: antitoxin Xre/MbcA/ParS toxin-binding domain-containing protein [Gemmatimonadaceae bacterium]
MTNAAIVRRLGGARVVRRAIRTDLDWVEALRAGLPPEAADALVDGEVLSAEELYRVVIPRRTLAFRKQRGQLLTPEESDRLGRVARALVAAEEMLGDAGKVHRWLRKPNRGLGGEVPLELLRTEAGARLVEQALGRIEHGIVA